MYLGGLNEVPPTMNDKDIDELILKSIRLKKKLAIAKALEGLYWMSGLNEIIQWIEDNVTLDPNRSSEENFEDINKMFAQDNRSDLSDILGDQKAQFLEHIEDKIGQSPSEIEFERITKESSGLLESVTKFLRGLFRWLALNFSGLLS